MQSILQPISEKSSLLICQLKANTDDSNVLYKLYTLCIGSKLVKIIKKNQSMTSTRHKLEEVYAYFADHMIRLSNPGAHMI